MNAVGSDGAFSEEFAREVLGVDSAAVNPTGLSPDDTNFYLKTFYSGQPLWHLEGDASKAREHLNWEPRTSFKDLIRIMMESDLRAARKEKAARDTA